MEGITWIEDALSSLYPAEDMLYIVSAISISLGENHTCLGFPARTSLKLVIR